MLSVEKLPQLVPSHLLPTIFGDYRNTRRKPDPTVTPRWDAALDRLYQSVHPDFWQLLYLDNEHDLTMRPMKGASRVTPHEHEAASRILERDHRMRCTFKPSLPVKKLHLQCNLIS